MIHDLLAPTNHSDPYVWAAVLLAHATVCQVLMAVLIPALGPWWAVASVSAVYLLVWEGAQLRAALRRGDRAITAMADGAVDWVGVSAGAYAAACLSAGEALSAAAVYAALLAVAIVGYQRRA